MPGAYPDTSSRGEASKYGEGMEVGVAVMDGDGAEAESWSQPQAGPKIAANATLAKQILNVRAIKCRMSTPLHWLMEYRLSRLLIVMVHSGSFRRSSRRLLCHSHLTRPGPMCHSCRRNLLVPP